MRLLYFQKDDENRTQAQNFEHEIQGRLFNKGRDEETQCAVVGAEYAPAADRWREGYAVGGT